MPRIPAADRRAALIEAALVVVARDGVSAATTRAIVAQAGMSLASFHYAFRSRDELLVCLVQHVLDAQSAALAGVLVEAGPPSSADALVRAGLDAYMTVLREHPERELALQELATFARRAPQVQPLLDGMYAQYRGLAASVLRSAEERGFVTWMQPVEHIAELIVALTDGITLAWLAHPDDAAVERMLDFAARAIAASAAAPPRVPVDPASSREAAAGSARREPVTA